MSNIIDRRKNDKKKSLVNRKRFLKRAQKAIKKRVDEIVSDRNIRDVDKGDSISIPKKDVQEPHFNHGKGGNKDYVMPGNKDKIVNDTMPRPDSGEGAGPEASDSGDGEDDFTFNVSREEFLDFFFEDLELPDLVKTSLKDLEEYKYKRAGLVTDGYPANLNIIRSMQKALGRQIALQSPFLDEIEVLKEQISDKCLKCGLPECLYEHNNVQSLVKCDQIKELAEQVISLQAEVDAVPFIDEIDLRFNAFEKTLNPTTSAVMICLMDVSASMGEFEKDLAKRFYILLYLFLRRKYKKVEVVFIRHTSEASEVDEHTFFYDQATGGTKVSSGLKLTQEIIASRYPTSEYNIYVSQASDGDNLMNDMQDCLDILRSDIMDAVQYFAYVQVAHMRYFNNETIWNKYKLIQEEYANFAMQKLDKRADIYPVFRELFTKEN